MRSDRALLLTVLAIAGVSACDIEKVEIPRPEKRLALHGVLSATAASQVVLLERTRNGSVYTAAPPFDLENGLGSDSGIAEGNAIVTMTAPDGSTLISREDVTVFQGTGVGVYRFYVPGSALQRGGVYRLNVRTSKGELMSAQTTVPSGVPADVPQSSVFDRSQDPMLVSWPAVAGARSYFVRIESPFGPRSFFTDSTHVRLAGDLRNADLDALPHVFIPGFPQVVTVSAVDSNYYDWFRTQNNEISGTGLISRVTGGLGVFGSLVRLYFHDIETVGPQSGPSAGTFTFVGAPGEERLTPFLKLELWVESVAARGDQPDAITGRYTKRSTLENPGCPVCGLLGSVKNGHVELAFLRAWSARDTLEVFSGEIHGDTIVGKYLGISTSARFVKQR
ncbi:MAG: DUF4249 family protein [bacterium]